MQSSTPLRLASIPRLISFPVQNGLFEVFGVWRRSTEGHAISQRVFLGRIATSSCKGIRSQRTDEFQLTSIWCKISSFISSTLSNGPFALLLGQRVQRLLGGVVRSSPPLRLTFFLGRFQEAILNPISETHVVVSKLKASKVLNIVVFSLLQKLHELVMASAGKAVLAANV